MYNLIAPSFFQKKACLLPGIGQLELVTHAAETDFLNNRIKAPYQEITFSPEAGDEKIFNEFSAISEMMQRKLHTDGIVALEGMGNFTVGSDGTIQFAPVKPAEVFYPAVVAERVIRQDAQHAILVGDKETNNVVMTEYFNEDTAAAKDWWWVWAIVLGALALGSIVYHFSKNGVGNFSNVAGF